MSKIVVIASFYPKNEKKNEVKETILAMVNPTRSEKGKLATNAQLVEKAIRIVNDLGVSIMTPAETREQLKLKNYK